MKTMETCYDFFKCDMNYDNAGGVEMQYVQVLTEASDFMC